MVVLVTGARSGIGKVTALALAAAGHVVYAGLRRLDTAGDLIAEARGLDIRPLQLDIVDPIDRAAAVARVVAEEGRLDALVNNAGIALGGFLETVDEDELREVFEVNVFATWALTKAVLPTMRHQGGGTVIMVSSMSGRMAVPGLGAYNGSKFALEGLSEAWRHELALFGIKVVLVEPGPYKTDIFGRNRRLARNARDPSGPYAPWVPGIERLAARRAARSGGDPRAVADKIVALVAARNPPLRVPMGTEARARTLLLRCVSFRAVELLFRRVLAQARGEVGGGPRAST